MSSCAEFKSDTNASVVRNKTWAKSLARREAYEWVEDVMNNKVNMLVLGREDTKTLKKNMMMQNNNKPLITGNGKDSPYEETSRVIDNYTISKGDIHGFVSTGSGWPDLFYTFEEEEEIWTDTVGDVRETRETNSRITFDNETRCLSKGYSDTSWLESTGDAGDKEEEDENYNINYENPICSSNNNENCAIKSNENIPAILNDASMSDICKPKGTSKTFKREHFGTHCEDKNNKFIEDFYDYWMDGFEPKAVKNRNKKFDQNLETPINNQQMDELSIESQTIIYRIAASILLYKEIKDYLKIDIEYSRYFQSFEENASRGKNDGINISRSIFRFGEKENFGCDLNKDLDGIQSSNNNCFKLTNALY